MADPVAAPWRLPVPREAVADSAGACYWSVYECRWAGPAAGAPDELAELAYLLAPPIAVGTAPLEP